MPKSTGAATIDTHHHFWKYNAEEYPWIGEHMRAIARDFLPADLATTIRAAGIDAVVSVQARQTVEETRWLLEMASEHDFIAGVVGWVPLADPCVEEHLDRFCNHPKLKSIRHVLQDEPDDNYVLRPDFNAGVAKLHERGLIYDILIYERHLPQTIEFVDRHPNQVFVLDHIAKPRIKDRQVSPWRERIAELAKRENVRCKISGMATEADWRNWTEADIAPYVDVVLAAFSPARLMFGSDWPVMLVASDYARWHRTVTSAISKLAASEQEKILGATAAQVYRLDAKVSEFHAAS
ncbi:MAG: amidohydrolase family protein [Bryobacteraceae bacterium]